LDVKILYVEDDPTAREYIEKGLREHGHVVDVAGDGRQGLELALGSCHDLLILDVNLPEMDGFELLHEVRQAEMETPALFLSARDEVNDRVHGLNLGADDYLTKPFAFAELLARIQAVARRRLAEPKDGVRRVADLELDVHRHKVTRGSEVIDLTLKEFTLLEYLITHQSHVLSRTMIIEKVWGASFDTFSNVIDVHINHLRRKIDKGFETKLIHTVKGVGYVLEERPS
jgi:two-component system copper resistance phosphate regulon response regulator CusR